MSVPSIPETRMGRLQYIADALGVPVPAGLSADLLDADQAPAQAVCAFCAGTGASLDFIYRGDIRSMLLGDFHKARETRLQQHDGLSRAYQVEALLRCAMLAEENESSGLDWKGVSETLDLAAELMREVTEALEKARLVSSPLAKAA